MSMPAGSPDPPPSSAHTQSVSAAWGSAPAVPVLTEGAVHVWRADLGSLSADRRELLSPQERARADGFAHARDRERWTRAHGLLRELLGRYLACDPRSLRFIAGANGKPALAPAAPGEHAAACFNMSHSQHLALYAFAAALALGADVEVAHRPMNELAIAARLFGSAEAERLGALDPAAREREFLRLWTRHEAAVKCAGVGIGRAVAEPADAGLWIAELEMGPRAAGAVAVQRAPSELRCWTVE